jgi:ribosome-associated protein
VEEQLHKELQRSPEHREGRGSAEWALLDYGSFIVHVFGEQARRFYDLERLWRSAPKLVLADEPEERRSNSTFADVNSGELSSAEDTVAP